MFYTFSLNGSFLAKPSFIKSILALFGLLLSVAACAQYDREEDASIPLEHFYIKRQGNGMLRAILSKIHFGLSTGYGSSSIKQDLDGFLIIQQPDSLPKIFREGSPIGYSNWTNRVTEADITNLPGSFQVNSDTTEIGFKSKTFHIPLRATMHIEFNRYRVGLGYSFEYTRLNEFEPTRYGNSINNFDPGFSGFFLKKYFVMAGVSVYRYYEYLLTIDVNIGGYGLGNKFNKAQISRGMFFNAGATVEREMSEYFRVFARPSFELKSFTTNLPENGGSVKSKFNAFYLNVGVSYRIPVLRKCFLKNCRSQINHVHGNREYRSRVHPIYKKQNPHYGENHPKLLKYKGKNKRKLNPY